ncbi:hypothetical protein N8350_02575, partial [Candidatus Nanopelagicales bacterium]|nr:hypothetical protein [Candidatus Nanopelagicales bacterium]
LFVAVASSGTGNRVMTSPDGITWTSRTSAADNAWRSVTYGAGLFVAVASYSGTGNRVMTSPNGITWTSRTSAADNNWQSVTYRAGLFVAVASSGTGNRVMTSGTFTTGGGGGGGEDPAAAAEAARAAQEAAYVENVRLQKLAEAAYAENVRIVEAARVEAAVLAAEAAVLPVFVCAAKQVDPDAVCVSAATIINNARIVSTLDAQALSAIPIENIGRYPAQYLAQISPVAIRGLRVGQLNSFSAEQVKALPAALVAGISRTVFAKMKPDVKNIFTATQIKSLDKGQVTSFLSKKPQKIKKSQIRALNFTGVAPKTLADSPRSVLRKLSVRQINNLTDKQYKLIIKQDPNSFNEKKIQKSRFASELFR